MKRTSMLLSRSGSNRGSLSHLGGTIPSVHVYQQARARKFNQIVNANSQSFKHSNDRLLVRAEFLFKVQQPPYSTS
jgi:hypothetical protein